MTAQILPAESGGLTQVKGNATYKNHAGQYVLRPNLTRHCLALVGRTTETAANYGIFTSSGLCCLSQSLSAAFMRVCQPLPVALNASTTSGEQRKVTRTLGFIAFGRPSLTNFSPSYNAAPEKNASSSSGASSGSVQVFFKSCVFAFIGFPHGDNTPHVTAWRPDQDYNAPIKFSGCYIPRFAVVFAYILSGKMFTRKHLTSPRKIKAALVKRPVAFVIVEVNFHTIIVRTKNNFANSLHWLALMAGIMETIAVYSCSLGFRSPFNLKLPPVPLRLTFRDFKYSSRANSIGLNSESSGESLSGFMVMTCALFWVSICCSYLVFLPLLSRSFNRHASITHAEKFRDFSSSRAAAICSSILYEKRIFFVAVLLVFGFFGMATPRVVWCFVDNFRQGEVNVIDLYQDNLSELTQTEAVKKHLRTHNGLGYVNAAPYKTGVGIGTPNMYTATSDAESVFFVVRYTRYSMAWYAIQQQSYNRRSTALLSYHAANNGAVCPPYAGVVTHSGRFNSTPRRQRMVTLAGQPQGWPVSVYAGSSNPVNVTAPIEIGTSSGDSLNLYAEAA